MLRCVTKTKQFVGFYYATEALAFQVAAFQSDEFGRIATYMAKHAIRATVTNAAQWIRIREGCPIENVGIGSLTGPPHSLMLTLQGTS